jgi:hypothetical protein
MSSIDHRGSDGDLSELLEVLGDAKSGAENRGPDIFGNLDQSQHFAIYVKTSGGIVNKISLWDFRDRSPDELKAIYREIEFVPLSKKWLEFSLGFFEAAPLLTGMAGGLHIEKAQRDNLKYIEDVAVRSVDLEGSTDTRVEKAYVLHKRNHGIYRRRMNSLIRFQRQTKAYSDSFILSLVARYEAMVADVVRAALRKQPRIYISSGTTVSAVDVIDAQDIAAIKERIIEDKLDGLLRQSHDQLVLDFLSKLKIEAPPVQLMNDFKEICERRNLITHAGGVVNSRYISNVVAAGGKEKDLQSVGETLESTESYIMTANARTSLLGFWIIYCVWMKLYPDQVDLVFEDLNNAIHEFLVFGFTKMARRLCEFALSHRVVISEVTRAYIIVNLALSFHLEEDLSESERKNGVRDALARRDWTIVNPRLSLALCCIHEEFDIMGRRIDEAVQDGVGMEQFSTWALFSKVRKHEIFRKKMKQHFDVEVSDDGEFDQKITSSPTS